MFLSMLMLLAWQTSGDKYKTAFDTSTQAYYQGSEVKTYVDKATENVRQDYPFVAGAAPLVYTIGMKREIKFQSRKVTLVPYTTTTYQYNHSNRAGSIGVSWGF